MKRHFGSPSSMVLLLGRNLLAFVIFWILSFAFVQFGERVLGGWPASEAGQLLGCVVGVAIALRTRAAAAAGEPRCDAGRRAKGTRRRSRLSGNAFDDTPRVSSTHHDP